MLDDQPVGSVLETLARLCHELALGQYRRADELFKLTRSDASPEPIAGLAESFGMMMVQLETREMHLKQIIEDLRITKEQLERAVAGTIQAISLMVEIRDPYTAGHQRKVANIACAIAAELGLPQEQVDGIRMAGLIHDMGKICVPAEILCKPGSINEYEFGLIKCHSHTAYDILKGIEFPWPIAQIVLQHHERMDGSGYPDGISGKSLIFETRIVAVADVIDAMASHRPYRPALGLEMAFDEISKYKGTRYDPEVVGACLKLFDGDTLSDLLK
jgi:HD-GYP domain-containing protein (c-di-GMP phosphodiesterase class II)